MIRIKTHRIVSARYKSVKDPLVKLNCPPRDAPMKSKLNIAIDKAAILSRLFTRIVSLPGQNGVLCKGQMIAIL